MLKSKYRQKEKKKCFKCNGEEYDRGERAIKMSSYHQLDTSEIYHVHMICRSLSNGHFKHCCVVRKTMKLASNSASIKSIRQTSQLVIVAS